MTEFIGLLKRVRHFVLMTFILPWTTKIPHYTAVWNTIIKVSVTNSCLRFLGYTISRSHHYAHKSNNITPFWSSFDLETAESMQFQAMAVTNVPILMLYGCDFNRIMSYIDLFSIFIESYYKSNMHKGPYDIEMTLSKRLQPVI